MVISYGSGICLSDQDVIQFDKLKQNYC